MTRKSRRLTLIAAALAVIGCAVGLGLYAMKDSLSLFLSPAEIAEKNVQFFNKWRPQNETYLFLFRKHEQGKNAKEIPEFDPVIEAKEKEIANLAAALAKNLGL